MEKSLRMKILIVIGTRPEAIKLFPVILAFRELKDIEIKICLTEQHVESVADILHFFNIEADHFLSVLEKGQSLSTLCSKMFASLPDVFNMEKPNLIVVQGDTSTAFIASLCAFYAGIKVAHVEAGLRTNIKREPFPEEMNRRLISEITDYHFCPTQKAYDVLSPTNQKVWLTGNTGIDAVRLMKERIEAIDYKHYFNAWANLVPITVHRRENWDSLEQICSALVEIADKIKDKKFVFITHPNEQISQKVHRYLQGSPIFIFNPLDYIGFINLLVRSSFIITDSGGIQEEAAYLGKFVFVLRNATERSEGVNLGLSAVVGTKKEDIVNAVLSMETVIEPSTVYGDGFSSQKMANIIQQEFMA
jgi:UDP-N-acetylglucosamine 2-epimerase (non-hydrolysing)